MIERVRTHDPERDAGAFVSGEMTRRVRRWFEDHLLDCDDCWREVWLGREGRKLAESARELAPPDLRENVRAAVLLSEGRSRRRGVLFVPAAVAVALAVAATGFLVNRDRQPAQIAAALDSYRTSLPAGASPAGRAAPDLSGTGLRLEAGRRMTLAGMAVDAFSYRDAAGRKVILYLSASAFPEANGAKERSGAIHGWSARADGLSLLCGDRPTSYLLVGADASLLRRAEEALSASGSLVAT